MPKNAEWWEFQWKKFISVCKWNAARLFHLSFPMVRMNRTVNQHRWCYFWGHRLNRFIFKYLITRTNSSQMGEFCLACYARRVFISWAQTTFTNFDDLNKLLMTHSYSQHRRGKQEFPSGPKRWEIFDLTFSTPEAKQLGLFHPAVGISLDNRTFQIDQSYLIETGT